MITSQTNKPYEGKIRITVVNGKIAKIVDNGTVPVALQDEVYWDYLFPSSSFTGISTKFAGKYFLLWEQRLKRRSAQLLYLQ